MPTIRLDRFKGVNNKAHQSMMPDGYLRECVDMFIDNNGVARKKQGYTLKDAGGYTSIWADEFRCFGVKDGDLVEITELNGTYTATTIKAGMGYATLSFTRCNGNYYFVSDHINGVITDTGVSSFGLAQVNYQPTLTSTAGALPAGTYLVAVTALDANGRESGTKDPASITITANKNISLSNVFVSTNPRVTHIAIYCSGRNGVELYRIATITNGTTTYTINATATNKFHLDKIGINPAPLGQLIAYHYGHLYIASNKHLFYSEPRPKYEQWQPINHYRFASKITVIAPCENGLWIGTEKDGLFFITGKQPHHGLNALGDMQAFKKHRTCLKRGSEKLIEAEFISDGAGSYGYMSDSNEGLFLLMDNGQFANVTQNNINMPKHDYAVSAIINDSDSFKYMAIISGADVPTRSL